MTEQLANNAITTLNGGITATATSLTVTSATLFPTSPQFRILVDSELMLVTGVAGNVFTVTRGIESTVQTSHNSGANVAVVYTVGAIQQFRADTVQVGAFASRPAAGNAGRIYRTTDGNIMFVDTGSSWSPFGPVVPLTTPPAASNFTLIQTGGNGTIVDDAGGLFFSALSRNTGGEDSIFAAQNNPGGTGAAYTLTVGFIHTPGGKAGAGGFFSFHLDGIGLYNSGTTQIRNMTVYTTSAGDFRFQLAGKTGLTVNGSTSFDVGAYSLASGPMLWMRVQDDGTTNRTWSISSDGRHFKPVTVEARTTGFTSQPDKIGLYINPINADATQTVLSYTLTSP